MIRNISVFNLTLCSLYRRTSTPRSEEDDQSTCKDHNGGISVLAFNTKTERIVHRGTCLGRYKMLIYKQTATLSNTLKCANRDCPAL